MWPADEVCRSGIHIETAILHVGVMQSDLANHGVPICECVALRIRLRNARHLATTRASQLECEVRDALRPEAGDDSQLMGGFHRRPTATDTARAGKLALVVLSYDHHVDGCAHGQADSGSHASEYTHRP